jgi:hypothetical protein
MVLPLFGKVLPEQDIWQQILNMNCSENAGRSLAMTGTMKRLP